MSTLPVNSTFLPVLDDLLSPDFKVAVLPGQTPQTPAETPSAMSKPPISFPQSHTGQLTEKASNYAGVNPPKQGPSFSNGEINGATDVKNRQVGGTKPSPQNAASKIQRWWKVRNGKQAKMDNGLVGVDIRAERAKHSIRHSRTEDHVRHLETEVHRLKSALATERKLRSLQVEAIRSLWTQVQKVSSISPVEGSVMSQSMPNGLPIQKRASGSAGGMSVSLHDTLEPQPQQNHLPHACSCSEEIQNLKDNFATEMSQLRQMIDHLKIDNSGSKSMDTSGGSDVMTQSFSKRPLTLNLNGGSATASGRSSNGNVTEEKKEEIAGFANEMATSIIEDVKEGDNNN